MADPFAHLLGPPRPLMKKNRIFFKDPVAGYPCKLSIHAHKDPDPVADYPASSDEDAEPMVSVEFNLSDHTRITFPLPPEGSSSSTYQFEPEDYAFNSPLADKDRSTYQFAPEDYTFYSPLADKNPGSSFLLRASHFSSLEDSRRIVNVMMIPDEFPLERCYRTYLETEISSFFYEVVAEEPESKLHVRITASMEREMAYTETPKAAKEMEASMEGRWRDRRMDDHNDEDDEEAESCAVCFEAIRPIWSENVRLFCGHKFHCRCIAPWLREKNCCPLCRLQQVHSCNWFKTLFPN